MIKVTTPEFRLLVRATSNTCVLFTEIVVDSTIINIDKTQLLERIGRFDENTIIQIGGSNPFQISEAVNILQQYGFTKFNLNCGCPSDRVKKGSFGAILMSKPDLVCEIINTVAKLCNVELSLKIRTGIDHLDSYEWFSNFIDQIFNETQCRTLYIHARKCWLKGLSPKQNRSVPPLNYEFLYRIKDQFPDFKIVLNGGINKVGDVELIKNLDGLMIGRQMMKDIFFIKKIEDFLAGRSAEIQKTDIVAAVEKFLDCFDPDQTICSRIAMPLNCLMFATKGSKKLRRLLNILVQNKSSLEETRKAVLNFLNQALV